MIFVGLVAVAVRRPGPYRDDDIPVDVVFSSDPR
jgi:hypothetical protein